jgi:hypothetical protein
MTEVYFPHKREEDEKSTFSAAPDSPHGTSSGSDNDLEPMSDADPPTEPECKPAPTAPLPPDPAVPESDEMPKKGKGAKGTKKPQQPKSGVKKGKSAEAKIRETKKKLFNIISSL